MSDVIRQDRRLEGARWTLARLVLVACLLVCCRRAAPPPAAGWSQADALFHGNPKWLGSDAAYSVALGSNRTLWLFGDTFVATTASNVRAQSKMVRNTFDDFSVLVKDTTLYFPRFVKVPLNP